LKDLQAVVLAAVSPSPVAPSAGEKEAVSPVPDEHGKPAHTLSFETPAGWTVTSTPGDLELTEVRDGGLIVHIAQRQRELSLDSRSSSTTMVSARFVMDASVAVWKKHKAARKLLTLGPESLKWR
jgi:hypothetical protein